jgi:small subunit ribosomal protein S19
LSSCFLVSLSISVVRKKEKMARSVWKGQFVEESLWLSMRRRVESIPSSFGNDSKVETSALGKSDALALSEKMAGVSRKNVGAEQLGGKTLYAGEKDEFAPVESEAILEQAATTSEEKVTKKGGFKVVVKAGDSHLQAGALKSWSRGSTIVPEWVGLGIYVYNGQNFHFLSIKASMVGTKLGEYAKTRKAGSHIKTKKGGKGKGKK